MYAEKFFVRRFREETHVEFINQYPRTDIQFIPKNMEVGFLIVVAPENYLEYEENSPVLFRLNFENKKIDFLKFKIDYGMFDRG